ncbi:MAG: FkbM family methyltransferase [Betaproteobacteria bacterium]|nr:FkbM family methyltransferase [Betaproteobacteria bacterium]
MNRLPISVFIIAKNEADRISVAIRAVKDWVDEVIVIDSGSNDETVKISESLGARCVFRAWEGYGPQKSFGESLCRNKWLLNIDADEEISAELKAEIIGLFAAPPPDHHSAYRLPVLPLYPFQTRGHSATITNFPVRLYRRDRAGFSASTVHDSVIVQKGRIGRLHGVLVHRSFRSLSHHFTKINDYTSAQAADWIQRKGPPYGLEVLMTPPLAFIKSLLFRREIVNGLDGIVISYMYATQRFMRIAKVRETFKMAHRLNDPRDAAWGIFHLHRLAETLRRLCARIPPNAVGRRLALLLRRMALVGAGSWIDGISEGIRLRVARRGNVSDRKFLFMPQFVDPFERDFLSARATAGGYFLDIGANAGVYSLTLAKRYEQLGGGRVFAFEPNPGMADRLRGNAGFNAFGRLIDVQQLALADRDGHMTLHLDTSNLGQSSLTQVGRGAGVDVQTRTLAGFLTDNHLGAADGLKIDVEGAEDQVLGTFMRDAGQHLLPGCIVIENSEADWSEDLFGLFASRGYRLIRRTRMNSVFALT